VHLEIILDAREKLVFYSKQFSRPHILQGLVTRSGNCDRQQVVTMLKEMLMVMFTSRL